MLPPSFRLIFGFREAFFISFRLSTRQISFKMSLSVLLLRSFSLLYYEFVLLSAIFSSIQSFRPAFMAARAGIGSIPVQRSVLLRLPLEYLRPRPSHSASRAWSYSRSRTGKVEKIRELRSISRARAARRSERFFTALIFGALSLCLWVGFLVRRSPAARTDFFRSARRPWRRR